MRMLLVFSSINKGDQGAILVFFNKEVHCLILF